MIGRVTSVNELIRSVTISPFNSVLKNEVVVEAELLVKYIVAGAHVKVLVIMIIVIIVVVIIVIIIIICINITIIAYLLIY